MKNLLRALIVMFTISVATMPVAAHAQAVSTNGGSIQGTITDPSGAAIPNAAITVTSPETGYSRKLTSDGSGFYSVGPLNPGNYSVTVSAPSFENQVLKTVIRTGTATTGSVKLVPGNQNETIEVDAGALQINTEQAGVSDVITGDQIKSLPVNGRNFLDLAQIEPGVILQSGESFDPTKAGYSAISVSGVSGRTTRILLDGQDITDETVGTTIFNVSQGAISEFQLNRSTQDVSGQITSTGQVLVSTNSGTNAFHGQAFYNFQDTRAGFAAAKNGSNFPFQRNQYGGSIGGFIIKDKLFFFGNAERIQQAQSSPSPVATGPGSLFSAIYTAHPSIPAPYRSTYSTARLDWNGPFHGHYFVRGSYDVDSDASNYGDGYWLYANRDNTPGIVGGADFAHGHFTDSVRVSYEKFHNLIADSTAGNSSIYNGLPGVAFYNSSQHLYSGPNYLAPQGTFQSDKQFSYDGSWTVGRHNIRYGYALNEVLGGGFAAFFGLSPRISISSTTLFKGGVDSNNNPVAGCGGVIGAASCPSDPLNGYHPGTSYIGNGQGFFTENPGFGLTGGGVHDYRSHAYASDNYKVTPDFTLNVGLGWSVDTDRANQDSAAPLCSDVAVVPSPCSGSGSLFAQWNPSFTGKVRQPYANFAPQIGINYSPGNHKTSIRAGFGLFYESDVFNNTTNARNVLIKQGAFFDYKNPCSAGTLTLPNGVVAAYIDGTPATGTTTAPSIKSACAAPLGTGGPEIAKLQQVYQANTKANSLSANGAFVGQTLNPTGAYAPTYRTPYSEQWNGGVQREIYKGAVLSVDYVHNSTLKIAQQVDYNHVGAARTFNLAAAQNAVAATTAAEGCTGGYSQAAVQCAITAGAKLSDFAGNGLDSGLTYLSGNPYAYNGKADAAHGAAFPGTNPLLGEGGFLVPVGRSGYDALQVVFKQQKAHPFPGVINSVFQGSYTLSRIVTTSGSATSSDEFFSALSWDNDNPTQFMGRANLDHTNELSFGGALMLKYGPQIGFIGHFYSAPPTSLTLDPLSQNIGGIFVSDVTGDGTPGDVAPGTNPGDYMHAIKGAGLNNYITKFNSTQVGKLTPAGQAVASSGLLTQAQLVAIGGALQPISQVPQSSAYLNPAFRAMDMNFSYPIRLARFREGLSLEPTVAIYNVFNMANYGASNSGVLLNVADAASPTDPTGITNAQLGYTTGLNNNVSLNNNRTERGSGTFDQGGPRSMEFALKLNF